MIQGEGALYEGNFIRLFANLPLAKSIPDYTTIMNLRHLLEKYKLSNQLFKDVNKWLSDAHIYFKEGTIVDVTIFETANFHGITEVANLLHGGVCLISEESGYRCV